MDEELTRIVIALITMPLYLIVGIGAIYIVAYRVLIPITTYLTKASDETNKVVENPFWPKNDSKKETVLVAKSSSEMVFFLSGISLVIGIKSLESEGLFLIGLAGIYLLLGLMIRKMSRTAVILSLVIYVTTKLLAFKSLPLAGSVVLFFVIFISLINGARAIFTYHKKHK